LQYAGILVLILVASLAEAFSVGAVFPFLGMIASKNGSDESALIQSIRETHGLATNDEIFFLIAIYFCAGVLLASLLRFCLLLAQATVTGELSERISEEVYRRSLLQPYIVHLNRNSSEIISGVQKAQNFAGNMVSPLIALVTSLCIASAIIAALLAISVAVTCFLFSIFLFVYGCVAYFTNNNLKQQSLIISLNGAKVLQALHEGLGGIREVLIDGSQELHVEGYRSRFAPLQRAMVIVQLLAGAPRYAIEAMAVVVVVLSAVYLEVLGKADGSAIPLLGAIALGIQRLLPVLQQIYSSITNIVGWRSSAIDVLDLLEQPVRSVAILGGEQLSDFNVAISLSDVFFRYENKGGWILERLNLVIPKRCRLGIIGPTGSGKSTLLDLLMGLISPTEGRFEVDGKLVTNLNSKSWQQQISHVPQTIFLADRSVAENIAIGISKHDIDMDSLRDAARIAQILTTVESLEDGFDTVIGEDGIRLSGGQRQRIGIARALYKKSSVIFFDEATSALDVETEDRVVQALEELGSDLTLVFVAHRLSTLRKCNLIFDLGCGRVLNDSELDSIDFS
jgi:ATP-binding cassette subfamily B protein